MKLMRLKIFWKAGCIMRSYYNEGIGTALIFYLLGKQQGGGTVPPITPADEWKTIVTDTTSGYL